MRDIAKQLDVSHATVSRALRDDPRISSTTRQRVKRAAATMGYRINAPARALSSRRMCTLALVVPDVLDPFYAGIIAGVDDVTKRHGYSLLLYITHSDVARERSALGEAAEGRYDGTILFRRHASVHELKAARNADVPFVLLTRHEPSLLVDSVRVDDIDGGHRATAFLLGLGHRRIGFIGGPRDQMETEDRFRGYRQALQSHGLAYDPALVWWGHFTDSGGRSVAEKIVTLPPEQRPSGVFAANDRMAIGLQQRLIELGLRVPSDVSIIGYDDIEPCQYVAPNVTTIRQPTTEMGRQAAELLIRRLRGDEFPPQEIVLKTEIVIRDSCSSA